MNINPPIQYTISGRLLSIAAITFLWISVWQLKAQEEAVGTLSNAPAGVDFVKIELPLVGHENVVQDLVFSPDNAQIATLSWDKTVRIWDPVSGDQVNKHPAVFNGTYGAINFSPDGSVVAVASDTVVHLLDVETGEEVKRIGGGFIPRLVFSYAEFNSDGSRLLTAGADSLARIWDVTSGALAQAFEGHDMGLGQAHYSPDEQLIVTNSVDKTARVFRVDTEEEILRIDGVRPMIVAKFSPDGQRIVTANDSLLQVWEVPSGDLAWEYKGTNWISWAVEFSPDGELLVFGDFDRQLIFCDAETGEVLEQWDGLLDIWESIAATPLALSFSSDGQRLAVSGRHKQAVILTLNRPSLSVTSAVTGHRESFVSAIPNPARDQGRIRFGVNRAGTLRLTVVDALGRVYGVLTKGYYEAGEHTVPFDASALPQGTYFLVLEGENRVVRSHVQVVR